MTDVVRVKECRLCDSRDLDLIVSFAPTPPGDHYVTADMLSKPQPCYPLDLLTCRSCGAVQLADTVDPSLIYPEYLYTTSVSKGLAEHFSHYAADVIRRVEPKQGALAIDIGSNDGTLLRALEGHGCRVLGVDPAKAIAAAATAAGVETHCAFFARDVAERLRLHYGPAEIITANHIFANVADLHDFTDGVKHLLAPDGTFVFETGYWQDIWRGNLIDTIEHEHLHYFDVAPLRRFFRRHDLELVSVERQPTKGGSIRGYVQHAGAKADRSVLSTMVEESTAPPTWADGIETLRQEIQALCAAGKTDYCWMGYGAAVGSTLLLHHFGLGDALCSLVDDNPQRQGLFSPGYHLHVNHPRAMKELPPDRIVILAWRYAETIMAQHPEHKGYWIIPLPELRLA